MPYLVSFHIGWLIGSVLLGFCILFLWQGIKGFRRRVLS